MNRFRDFMQRFMAGRNGVDTLGKVSLYTSLILILLSGLLFKFPAAAAIVDFAGIALLIYSYFRMFSRNISKRYEENRRFQKRFQIFSKAASDRTHRYYKCPSCGQTIRVPKGKGKIEIKCPKCGSAFVKRT